MPQSFPYEDTPVRRRITDALDLAQQLLTQASDDLAGLEQREDAHKVRNLAAGAQARRDVITQTWSLQDKERAA